MKVRFNEEELSRFSVASRDFNPLHLSMDYARDTSGGECYVYGILGFLACLRHTPIPVHQIPSEIRIDFKAPLFLNVDYTIRVEKIQSFITKISLMDGSATVLHARLAFRDGESEKSHLPEIESASRQIPANPGPLEIAQRASIRGTYSPARKAYEDLLDSLGIDRHLWGDALPLAALCTSYLTGMEYPGERAIYTGLRLKILGTHVDAPFFYEVTPDTFDDRFGLVKFRFQLGTTSAVWATGEISAVIRQTRNRRASSYPVTGDGRFAGKSALVIGASRGLGAALAMDLVAAGGTVLGIYHRSQKEANELLAESRKLPGRLTMIRGDASDLDWCISLKERIRSELGRLDLLICSAAPGVHGLRMEEACYHRIRTYIEKGIELVCAPLSVLLYDVTVSSGCVLTISSSAVEDPPAVWPHYVAMKSAVEGLIRTTAVAYPRVTFWIARPGAMLTAFSDTPMTRLDAEEPQAVAKRILDLVCKPAVTGMVHFCR